MHKTVADTYGILWKGDNEEQKKQPASEFYSRPPLNLFSVSSFQWINPVLYMLWPLHNESRKINLLNDMSSTSQPN